jgi:type II secretory pathway component PulM
MDLLASHMDLLVGIGAATLTLVVVTAVIVTLSQRLARISDDLKQLRQLSYLQDIEDDEARTSLALASVSGTPPQVSELKLHLWQLKRQQLILLDRVTKISATLTELRAMPNSLEKLKDEQARVLEALVTISAELEDWIARFDNTSSELTNLLESEPVVEFQNSLDPK